MRLESKNVHDFKTVFENIATTPQGVKALAEFFLHKLDAILALGDGRRLASFAYSVLASKVATDDEIAVVIIRNKSCTRMTGGCSPQLRTYKLENSFFFFSKFKIVLGFMRFTIIRQLLSWWKMFWRTRIFDTTISTQVNLRSFKRTAHLTLCFYTVSYRCIDIIIF